MSRRMMMIRRITPPPMYMSHLLRSQIVTSQQRPSGRGGYGRITPLEAVPE
jgi:hypothetical protein